MSLSPAATDAASNPSEKVILVADANAETRSVYATYFRNLAYQVEEAEDGRVALAKALTDPPSLLLTDVGLPGISGIELCRILRGDRATATTPVILTTSRRAGQDGEVEKAGVDSVLAKPANLHELAAEVRRLIDQSRGLRQRSAVLSETVAAQLARSSELQTRARAMSHRHSRGTTVNPPVPAATLLCPRCDHNLTYVESHVGGVSARYPEQWDYFQCGSCGGAFEYRQRTRKLRDCPFSQRFPR